MLQNLIRWLRFKRSRTLRAINNANIIKSDRGPLLAVIIALVDSGEQTWDKKKHQYGSLLYQPADIGFRETVCFIGRLLHDTPSQSTSYSLDMASSTISSIWSVHETAHSSLTTSQIKDMMNKTSQLMLQDSNQVTALLGELVVGNKSLAQYDAGIRLVQLMVDNLGTVNFGLHRNEHY